MGRTFHYTLEGERCVELNLTSDEYLYQGLIRHHSADEKMDILKLVSRLTGLKALNLRRNRVFKLPPDFRSLRELEQLNLGSNYLGGVPAEISAFSRLKYLHLGNNDIAELPAFLGEFQNLEYLTLHKNLKLKSVQALAGLNSLKALNLYFLNLGGRLPACIYEFKNLVTLTLWNIKDLSDELRELKNLEFFSNCGCPSLREAPAVIAKLKKLRMIRLFQNNLEKIPDAYGELENLEQISFYQNRLSTLPDSFARLSKLKKLNLGWNSFEVLPAWLGQIRTLEWLAVFENPLRESNDLGLPPTTQVLRTWPFSTLAPHHS